VNYASVIASGDSLILMKKGAGMRYLMLVVATVIATGMVACGKKNDSVANPNSSCGLNCGYGYGGVYGNSVGAGLRVVGDLENIGQDAFAQMLGQYGGFCQNNGWNNNPSQLNWSTTFGNWNCRNYARAGYVKMRFDQTGTRVQIKVGARGNSGFGGASLGGSANEVLFNGRIYPRNNSAGMEIRASGVQATGSWSAQYDNGLVIIIEQGSPSAVTMTGEVSYRGRPMGTVHFYQY
jgi:hypothetical protein